ncbi:hypothetical protein PAPYR_6470 [Paratrimastix pyriformis]|uniref:Uncharacterized protein n=1 Tax=Paratrimastix pyriformis TaxID=342808 RepID=A0ABQ8UKE6_9EUKA|nr:hypothetical protein PAPYR_6470 [Paratrimastix pyriformis]
MPRSRTEKFSILLDKTNRVFSAFDGYGESYKADPSFGQKTWVGGLIWLAFKFLMFVLFCINLVRLLQGSTLMRDGSAMIWNTETVPITDPKKLPALDVPPLNLFVSSEVYMFESKSPSVQRVKVVDNTGFHVNLDSATSASQHFPRASAVYGTTSVPLNRFFQRDMNTLLKSQQSHAFSSTELLYYLDNPQFKHDEAFYPHDFYAYFRLDPATLAEIKPCQLQLWTANVGEFNNVQDNQTLLAAARTFVSSPGTWLPPGWAASSFDDRRRFKSLSGTNLFTFHVNMTQACSTPSPIPPSLSPCLPAPGPAPSGSLPRRSCPPAPALRPVDAQRTTLIAAVLSPRSAASAPRWGALGWAAAWPVQDVHDEIMAQFPHTNASNLLNYHFGVNYAANFRLIKQGFDDGEGGSYSEYRWQAHAIGLTGNMLEFVNVSIPVESSLDPPFYVQLSNINGVEVVRVDQVIIGPPGTPDAWRVTRLKEQPRVDFTLTAGNLTLPKQPPDTWVCPDVWYGTHDGCDCSCGAYDPDCEESAMRVYHCYSSGSKCNRQASCVANLGPETDPGLRPRARICARPSRGGGGRLVGAGAQDPRRVFSPLRMFVSDPFDQSRLHEFGDTYIDNFVGQVKFRQQIRSSVAGALLPCPSAPLPVCASAPLPVCASAPLPVCASAPLPVCAPARLRPCPSAPLPVCAPASLRPCQSAPLPVCASAPLPVCAPLETCHLCPGDTVMDGKATLESDYVYRCYGAPLSWISPYTVGTKNTTECEMIRGDGIYCLSVEAECDYSVNLNFDVQDLLLEKLQVARLTNSPYSTKVQTIQFTTLPTKNHAVYGWLSGPFNEHSTSVFISHDTTVNDPPFEAVGPYNLLINNEIRATVVGAEQATVPSLQLMKLDNIISPFADLSWGSEGVVTSDTIPGEWTFNVTVHSPREMFEMSAFYYDQSFDCLVIPLGESSPSAVQIFTQVVTPIPPEWTCDPAMWGDGTCDCKCGAWDVDCFNLTEGADRRSPQCANNTETEYFWCVYPGFCAYQDMGDGRLMQTIGLDLQREELPRGTTVACREHPAADFWQYAETLTHVQLDRGSVGAFLPSDRHKPTGQETWTSPSNVEVTFAGFIVPKTPGFAEVGLHPQATTTMGRPKNQWADYCAFDKWVIDPLRTHEIREYTLEPFNRSICVPVTAIGDPPLSTKSCITEMPPTHKLPVYSVSFSTEYYLTFDSSVQQVENKFAEGLPSEGDTDETGSAHYFSGMARVMESDSAYPVTSQRIEIPATLPLVSTRLYWNLTETYLADIISKKPPNWPTKADQIEAVAAGFPALDLAWTLEPLGGVSENQTLVLQPGLEYTLSATLVLRSVRVAKSPLEQLMASGDTIKSWSLSVQSLSASVHTLDAFGSNKATVTYIINFDPNTRAQIIDNTYTLQDFFNSLGSLAGFGAMGLIVLKVVLTIWELRLKLPCFVRPHCNGCTAPALARSSTARHAAVLFSSPFGAAGWVGQKPKKNPDSVLITGSKSLSKFESDILLATRASAAGASGMGGLGGMGGTYSPPTATSAMMMPGTAVMGPGASPARNPAIVMNPIAHMGRGHILTAVAIPGAGMGAPTPGQQL